MFGSAVVALLEWFVMTETSLLMDLLQRDLYLRV